MKRRVWEIMSSFLISRFVSFRLPRMTRDDGISSCSLLRSSTSVFYVSITPLRLTGAMPFRVRVRVSDSDFLHTYHCATGHLLAEPSISSLPELVVSELRPCLPKCRFYSRTEGELYIKKIMMGDERESNYARK
jgi:hypothetical protein